MALVAVTQYRSTIGLVGANVVLFLKSKPELVLGIDFYITGAGDDYISGHDDEGKNLHVEVSDIEKILGPFDKRGGYIHHGELQKKFNRRGKRIRD
ncbi:hypothetical protein PPK15_gp38 [Bacillus phage 000TH010]|uniref:Uncharacterized protein n=1 Tax=Bacillus phage 000TH010 TaxID=2601652 RepID=A0A5P8PHS6_9CAUD|nr:hypothetical protein PPK15_gp38 [Bacillus phage 000TH010]QFR56251.1 hypothetical protein 000TH010_38 [Bacillus phage 000TH010]